MVAERGLRGFSVQKRQQWTSADFGSDILDHLVFLRPGCMRGHSPDCFAQWPACCLACAQWLPWCLHSDFLCAWRTLLHDWCDCTCGGVSTCSTQLIVSWPAVSKLHLQWPVWPAADWLLRLNTSYVNCSNNIRILQWPSVHWTCSDFQCLQWPTLTCSDLHWTAAHAHEDRWHVHSFISWTLFVAFEVSFLFALINWHFCIG